MRMHYYTITLTCRKQVDDRNICKIVWNMGKIISVKTDTGKQWRRPLRIMIFIKKKTQAIIFTLPTLMSTSAEIVDIIRYMNNIWAIYFKSD